MPIQQPKDVFEKEVQILKRAKDLIHVENKTMEEVTQEYENLSQEYEFLLNDARVMTRVSDRLQVRLNRAYDELHNTNDTLNNTNDKLNQANDDLKLSTEEINQKRIILQNMVDELTKTRVSKRATTITLTAAILLFIVTEVFFDPIIDKYFKNDFYSNLILKLFFALMLKPIDYLVEWYLLQDVKRKSKQNAATSAG
jgi:hypothetical protein